MAKTYRVSVQSALMEAERELVHKELEIKSLQAEVQRLTDCVGLLPPGWAKQFWFNWNSHPGLPDRPAATDTPFDRPKMQQIGVSNQDTERP